MRVPLLVCIGLCMVLIMVKSSNAIKVSRKPIMSFEEYIAYMNRTYKNESEKNFRQKIFDKNIKTIREHNKLYEKKLVSWMMGVDPLTDRTKKEVKELLGLRVSPEDIHDRSGFDIFRSNPNFKPLPEFDWRKQGGVTPIKSQTCGDCYIFASVAAVETLHFKKTGKLQSFSEQSILDCFDVAGCNGGSQSDVFDFIIDEGISTVNDYSPNIEKKDKCRRNPQKKVFKIDGYKRILDEKAILEAVQTIGPVTVGIDAVHITRSYFKGILSDTSHCKKMDHAVTIIGFGTEEGKDYFLVRNSWGKKSGEGGYFKVERNINYCFLTEFAMVPYVN